MPYPDVVDPYGPGMHTLGPELALNGDFASDSGAWFLQSGSISGGSLNVNDPVGFHVIATQSNRLVIGKSYMMTLEISVWLSGSVSLNCGQSSGTPGTRRSAVGSYSEILVAAGSLPSIVLQCGGGGFSGSIDRVSVREVLS